MTDGYHDCRSRHDLPVGRNVGESMFMGWWHDELKQFSVWSFFQHNPANQTIKYQTQQKTVLIWEFNDSLSLIHLQVSLDPAKYG